MAKDTKNGTTSLRDGLTRKNPPASDASMKPSSGSVNDAATRDSVAPGPKSLGPRYG